MTFSELINLLRNCKDAETINNMREEIAELVPAVRFMFEYDQNNRYHQYDLWNHCVHTVTGLSKDIDDDMVFLAALLHDIGKPSSKCKSKREWDTDSHYYGHPDKSEEIVREQIIPCFLEKGAELSKDDISRLLYYVKYHDDRVSLKIKHLKRHLKMVDINTFKNLMALQVADAKAHVILPLVQNRINICSEWLNGRADELINEIDRDEN